MQITVMRGAGDTRGDNVTDALLCSDAVARERGRREIDLGYPAARELVACQCPKHDYIATGSLASVIEAHGRYSGLVRYWSLTLTIDDVGERFTADTRLTLER